MPDVNVLDPSANDCIMTTHIKVLVRGDALTGVVNGNDVTPSSPESLVVNIAAGRIRVLGAPIDVLAGTVEHEAANATYPRIDTIYRVAATGALAVVVGTPAEIVDPKNTGFWKNYTSPMPSNSIPSGVILANVYIAALATTVTATEIWDCAVDVPDALVTVGAVGDDSNSPTEKAVRTALEEKIAAADIVTTVGDPGSDSKVPSEQAVREAINDVEGGVVTGGDAHDHTGGAGAQIHHGGLSGLSDDDHSGIYLNNTRGDARYAPIAKGVTGGDSHNGLHSSAFSATGHGHVPANTIFAAANRIMARKSTGGGAAEECTMAEILAWITRSVEANFQFGDGSGVVLAGPCQLKMPAIAYKIVAAQISSIDANADPLSGSATVTLYKHDRGAAKGSAVDTFAIASATNMVETGLNITVEAGKYLTAVISAITTCRCVVFSLSLEAT